MNLDAVLSVQKKKSPPAFLIADLAGGKSAEVLANPFPKK